MFSAFAAGAFLVVTGSIGWNVSHLHGFFQGGRWAGGIIWWQVALGVGFLLLGTHLFRRLGEPAPTRTRAPQERIVKHVGRGKTAAAEQMEEQRRRTDAESKT